jgi:hypothetical protein
VALLRTVIATVGPVHVVDGHVSPNLTTYHATILVAAIVALLAGVCALTVNDAQAAATMVRRTRPVPIRAPEPVPAGRWALAPVAPPPDQHPVQHAPGLRLTGGGLRIEPLECCGVVRG